MKCQNGTQAFEASMNQVSSHFDVNFSTELRLSQGKSIDETDEEF